MKNMIIGLIAILLLLSSCSTKDIIQIKPIARIALKMPAGDRAFPDQFQAELKISGSGYIEKNIMVNVVWQSNLERHVVAQPLEVPLNQELLIRVQANVNNGIYIGEISAYLSEEYMSELVVNMTEQIEVVATPIFGLVEGEYDTIQETSISCNTSGALIFYTLDGTDPSTNSMLYSEPIILTATTTINAIATKLNMIDSQIVSKTYSMNIPCTFFGNFALTNSPYSDTIDWSQKIVDLLGPYYRIVDWVDLENYYNTGNDLGAVFDGFGLTEYLIDVGLLWNGEQFWESRAYGCNRADGVLPGGYLLHDHINNYQFLLGSWSPANRRLLAIRTERE